MIHKRRIALHQSSEVSWQAFHIGHLRTIEEDWDHDHTSP
jgi:hypothetical protein